MNQEEIQAIVYEIFSSLFDDIEDSEVAVLTQESSTKWDSMMQVAIVSALEDEFDISIKLDDAVSLKTPEDCISLVSRLV